MRINADIIIYLFIMVCIALLIYNIAYIFRRKSNNRSNTRNAGLWRQEILSQFYVIKSGSGIDKKHGKKLLKRLVSTNSLLSYIQALEDIKTKYPAPLADYLHLNYVVFQELAYKYKRKDSMERAFYAYYIRKFPPCSGSEHKQIIDVLISYMENSTVYCHENVLCALYSFGNIDSIVKALGLMNEKGWFHHPKLISDGLATFTGDKEALASALWDKYSVWNNSIMLAIVQFITMSSSSYREEFFPILQDRKTDIEIRLAVMRYYRRHKYEPVKYILVDFLSGREQTNDTLAIVAASVLEKYPGNDTVNALRLALSSPSWYIRYNAAASLATMRDLGEELIGVLFGDDKYAREILRYKLEEDIKSEQEESNRMEEREAVNR